MSAFLDTKIHPLPWIVAHRGYRKKYPENTPAAFQAALDAGAPMIELDVWLTRDRKTVVIHDPTLERTTNGRGPVNEHTLEQLQRLDAGSWFHSDFADQKLPGLPETVDQINGRARLNIEIKSGAHEPHDPPDAIERQVVDLVREKNFQDRTLLSSFSVPVLERLASMEDSPPIALISMDRADKETVKLCRRLKVFSWHPYYKVLTREQVEMMHAAGIKVLPFTVNKPRHYRRMLAMAVDGVITDDPLLDAV